MKTTWYQQLWESQDIPISNPALARYLDPDQAPKFQTIPTIKLLRQLMPLTPIKELAAITPQKLGRVLGQRYASIYALGEYAQSLAKDPQAVERSRAVKAKMEKGDDVQEELSPEILLVHEFVTNIKPKFENNVEQTFKAALDRGNYQEALEFFQGFAEGFALKGFQDGSIVRKTRATELHLNMFMRARKFQKFENVKELRNYLWDNGFSLETLPDSRLQKYCQRIKFTPGKRGRPARKINK
jgi:hypothetical protein